MSKRVKPARSTLVFFSCVLGVPTMACILYGTPANATLETFAPLIAMGAVLGFAHLILRPIIRFITAPLGCITFGLSGTCIDVALIYLSAHFVPGLYVPSFLYALLTALLINAVIAFVGGNR